MPKIITTDEFISRAKHKHGEKYNYSLVVYMHMNKKVIIICPTHGKFLQTPDNHLRSNGCKKCAYEFTRYKKTRHTTKKFIEKARKLHGKRYDYSITKYINDSSKLMIRCPIHGKFKIVASSHLQGIGCSKCSGKYSPTTKEFISLCHIVHGTTYDYSLTNYKNIKTKVKINCLKHGTFKQLPYAHLQGQGCPLCFRQYSKKAVVWLENISLNEGIHIQHAENGGEYIIPGTKYKVDGFCKETNTVYEFYGDIFHGNPNLFKTNERCGPSEKTAGELFKQTIKREERIKEAGYNVITIWENDWNEKQKEIDKSSSIYRHSFWAKGELDTS